MSLVSFWIFVLVDMSTYLSPILTIMPPRIEGSDCEEDTTIQIIGQHNITAGIQPPSLELRKKLHQLQNGHWYVLGSHALTLYLCFQLDSFTLLKEAIESYFQLRKVSCIQRLKWIHIHWLTVQHVYIKNNAINSFKVPDM